MSFLPRISYSELLVLLGDYFLIERFDGAMPLGFFTWALFCLFNGFTVSDGLVLLLPGECWCSAECSSWSSIIILHFLIIVLKTFFSNPNFFTEFHTYKPHYCLYILQESPTHQPQIKIIILLPKSLIKSCYSSSIFTRSLSPINSFSKYVHACPILFILTTTNIFQALHLFPRLLQRSPYRSNHI